MLENMALKFVVELHLVIIQYMSEDMTKELKVGHNLISGMKKCVASEVRLENFDQNNEK